MKDFSTILICCFLQISLISQNLSGKVEYSESTVIDTIKNIGSEKEGILFFDIGENKSIYITERVDKPETESHTYERKEDGSTVSKKKNKSGDKIGKIVFKDFKENK